MHPIGLEELVERAALLTRVDRKYVLPTVDLPALLHGLGPEVRVLEIDGRREFGYRSDYFDTPSLEFYLATAHQRRRRYKVRVRGYLDTGGRYLEVKTREARGGTVKHRFQYPEGDGDGLDERAYADIGGVLPGARRRMDRVLVTWYRRTTLYLPASGARVTVDSDVQWNLPDGATVRMPDRAVVETKSPGVGASPADRLLWSLGHRPCALSKFGTGLAVLRPDLPANRWQPLLRRHFRRATDRRW
ncbi:polyphosphate polymerase domain-containing protein [Micromonospora sp. CPCC 205371]|nr:polyphosphate polymerase domain-containing protein [Micromonospora sp. CPCC 205371]